MAAGLMSAGGFYEFVADGAGPHNSIYRGKYLGSSVTTAQYAAISDGTFSDLFIGDYWTIGGVNWRIAAFDYFLHAGDTECTKHHAVIVPDTALYSAKMNASNTTAGGYVGSAMYTTNLAQAKTTIKAAFSGHVLNHRTYMVNAVSNGAPSGGTWLDSEVELMSEKMVYGCPIFEPMCDGVKDPFVSMHNYTIEKSQFPLFVHNPTSITIRFDYWLKDVVSAAFFAFADYQGRASYSDASANIGVRPFFCLF